MGSAQDRVSDELMARAFRERDARRFERALELFETVWQRTLSPRVLAQRAITEQAMGRWPLAYTHYQDALNAASDPWITEHRAPLERALVVVRERVALVELRGGPVDAEVRIDGERAGILPLRAPLALEPGIRVLEVRAMHHTTLRRAIAAVGGQSSVEVVSMRLGEVAGGDETSGSGRGAAWAFTAGAGVALIGGVVAHVFWADAREQYGRRCLDPSLLASLDCTTGVYVLARDEIADPARVGMIVGYGAAFALGVTAIVLHVRAPPASATAARAGVRWAPTLGPGFQCAVSF